jgi:uncharacterized protein
MNLYDDLLAQIPVQEYPVKNIVVGCHWTLVTSRKSGLASTLMTEGIHGQHPVRDVGQLHKKSANELAQWIQSENMLEVSIGLAALNSLLEVDETRAVEINASEVISRRGKGKNIAVVGHFPFIERLKPLAKNLWVIEKKPAEGDFPEQASTELIPQADVVAITGTSIINRTAAALLKLCRPDALVVMLGPSTPLCDCLFQHGVTLLSGTVIVDETAAVHTIQQGAIFPQVQGVRLLTLSAEKGESLWNSQ